MPQAKDLGGPQDGSGPCPTGIANCDGAILALGGGGGVEMPPTVNAGHWMVTLWHGNA